MRMQARYITAENYDMAVAEATEIFACNQEDLSIEIISEGSEEHPNWTILATSWELSVNANAGFNLLFEDGGVYLEVYPARGSGAEQAPDLVSKYLQRKNIAQLNALDALSLLRKGYGRVKVAPTQDEKILDEDISFSISRGDMEAQAKLLPPDAEGSLLTLELIHEKLTAAEIVFGIDDTVLSEMLSDRIYDRSYTIARGKEVTNGDDGKLDFHFRRELSMAPKDVGNDRVDLRTLDLFETVSEGQLLVTRTPPTSGEPGVTVKGRELAPKPGKDIRMPKVKNAVINEENTTIISSSGGMVTFTNNTVFVSSVYQINGDCDMSVGNIDFNGSVNITGNVISNMIVKATGNIVVGGVVESSQIIAGGSIELKRGIQGNMDKGKLIAGGDIVAQFIERASASAEGNIMADVIIHSSVVAGRSVIMSGKRASIIGGTLRLTEEVVAKTLGTMYHVQTDIEVGIHPRKRDRMKFLQDNLAKLKDELEKLEKLAVYLSKPKNNLTEQERLTMRKNALLKAQELANTYSENTEELNRITVESDAATNGRVHVSDTVNPGVKISISAGTFKVEDTIQYATFKYRQGELTFVSYEGP